MHMKDMCMIHVRLGQESCMIKISNLKSQNFLRTITNKFLIISSKTYDLLRAFNHYTNNHLALLALALYLTHSSVEQRRKSKWRRNRPENSVLYFQPIRVARFLAHAYSRSFTPMLVLPICDKTTAIRNK